MVSPQEINKGDFFFAETGDLDKINIDYPTTINSLKEFFFPRVDVLFQYRKTHKGNTKIFSSRKIDGGTVYFGLHSCDVRGVYFQDCFFANPPEDALYAEKRQKSILISLACNKPQRESCFCAYLKNGPFLEKGEGFDLQLIDMGEKYLVETGSPKGGDLIKKYRKYFIEADESLLRRRNLLKEKSLVQFKRPHDLDKIYAKLKNADLEVLWERLAERCLNCGGCEFSCPSCYCFYTQDVPESELKGKRIRAWDSCIFSGYSRMAGGANPNEKKSSRISRRFCCKLFNSFRWFGMFSCTGCGRCSSVCPANLDMESFIAGLINEEYRPLLKEL